MEWYGKKKNQIECEICHDTYSRINEKHYKYGGFFTPNGIEVKIFFPFDDVYPQALMTNYPLQKVNSTEAKIRAAFCYLQCDRMKELLENKSSDDPEYAFFNELYWKYDLYCFNAGCMPSNYGRKNNELAYETMKAILESFKVGIMNRD